MATTTEDAPTGPAPAKEMPANLVQTEGQNKVDGGQVMPTINPLPDPQTVTPLHLLEKGPHWIDCPFCQRRAKVRIDGEGTAMQMVCGVLCCIFCVCFTCIPFLAGWFENTTYRCAHCSQVVALRPYDSPMQTFGPQPGHAQMPSQYYAAPASVLARPQG